jgi:ATP-dependent exoDNAse (exonuclease V) beta subunit
MHSPATLEIYKASAGSGKTFSLTLQYLQLALRHPANYRRILAVTFTNQATAEMKKRILHVLEGLATGSSSSSVQQYRQLLLQALAPIDPQQLQAQAAAVYSSLLHDYSCFSVSTIDAFVQRIIRSFAWELGIDGGFKLQLNEEPVLLELANRLYTRLDTDKQLQSWLTDMATERLDAGKSWDFRESLTELASEIFKERFKDFEASLATRPGAASDEAFQHLHERLRDTTAAIEEKWQTAATATLAFIASNGLKTTDFAYGKSSFANYFNKVAANGRPLPIDEDSRHYKAMHHKQQMVSKSMDAGLRELILQISGQLQASLAQFSQWYDADNYRYCTAQAILRNIRVLRLMRILAEEMGHYRKENNTLLISDTHYLLRQLTSDSSAAFIYEKTGQRYQHYLIDEFQDTSTFQWENFLPLLTEALSSGHYNMLVGDVKQAIYRWRSGDWRLLLYGVQKSLQAFAPVERTLQDNHRSARPVIEFNNLVFYLAPQLLQQALLQSLNQAPPKARQPLLKKGYGTIFSQAYADSYQQVPATAPADGLVSLQWQPADHVGDYDDWVLPALQQQIASLLAEGYQPADIAVLTRTNAQARKVVQYLMAQQPDYLVMSGDALTLANNQAVQLLIAAMQWLCNSQNSIALAQVRHLLCSLQAPMPNRNWRMYDSSSHGDNSLLPPALEERMHYLRSLPVHELLHQLIMLFDLHKLPGHAPYLLALADVVQEWSRYGEAGLLAFLQFWEKEGIDKTLPASRGVQAVEVVTIHKAKGLAYEVVLMPYLDWAIIPAGGKQAATLWVDTRHTIFNEIALVPVAYNNDLAKSAFAEAYYEEFVLAAMDSLNMLYVAFTRVRRRLYGWAPWVEPAKEGKFQFRHVGHLLQQIAESTMPLPATPAYTDSRGMRDEKKRSWIVGVALAPSHVSQVVAPPPVPVPHYQAWQQVLRVRPAQLQQPADEALTLPRAQGILLHQLLSQLPHPAALPKVILQAQRQGWLDEYQARQVKDILEKVLQLPALAPWQSGQYKRLAERSMVDDKGELRRPDLVLYHEAACLVYDFKFTTGDKDKAKHTAQVQQYMQLLQRMGFASPRGYVVYGLEATVVEIENNGA